MEPNDNLKVFMNFRRLKDIKRCNNFPVVSVEDVAQHSYYVTLLAMSLATEYNHWAGNNNLQYHPYDDEHRMEIADVTVISFRAPSEIIRNKNVCNALLLKKIKNILFSNILLRLLI